MTASAGEALRPSLPPLVTTSYVFDEVVTFFNSRNQHAKATEIGNRLVRSPTVQLAQVDEALFYDAWRYFTQHTDKPYSLTDCFAFLGSSSSASFRPHSLWLGFDFGSLTLFAVCAPFDG